MRTTTVFPKRILLSGYYGMKNGGDDALANVCCIMLTKLFDGVKIVFISPRYPLLAYMSNCINFGGKHYDKFFRLIRYREILRSDCLVFGGGGIIQNYGNSGHLKNMLRAIRLAKLLKKPVFLLGIGIGPLATLESRQVASGILRNADLVTTRDQDSFLLGKDLTNSKANIHLAADIALLFDCQNYGLQQNKSNKKNSNTLGISIHPFEIVVRNDYLFVETRRKKIIHALRLIMDKNPLLNVKIIIINGHDVVGDEREARLIAMALDEKRVCVCEYNPNSLNILNSIGSCDWFISMRLHGAIFSYMRNVPCIILSYHPKTNAFAKTVGFDQESLVDANSFTGTELANRVFEMMSREDKFKGRLPFAEARRLSNINFELLANWYGTTYDKCRNTNI